VQSGAVHSAEGAPADPAQTSHPQGLGAAEGPQLFVNYGDARIEPSNPSSKLYKKGTFFSRSTIRSTTRPIRPCSSRLSARRFRDARCVRQRRNRGRAARDPDRNRALRRSEWWWHRFAGSPLSGVTPSGAPVNALYVTASVIYGKNDFDPPRSRARRRGVGRDPLDDQGSREAGNG
jgi:hypothetical protein